MKSKKELFCYLFCGGVTTAVNYLLYGGLLFSAPALHRRQQHCLGGSGSDCLCSQPAACFSLAEQNMEGTSVFCRPALSDASCGKCASLAADRPSVYSSASGQTAGQRDNCSRKLCVLQIRSL